MTVLVLVGGIFLLALLAGFVPLISVELALILSAATGRSIWILLAQAAVAAAGLMIGKSCFFLGGRGTLAWARRRPSRTRIRLPGILSRASSKPQVAAATVFVSAATGVPPFAFVSPLAGGWRLGLSSFFMVGLAGKAARFAGLVFVPGALAAFHP